VSERDIYSLQGGLPTSRIETGQLVHAASQARRHCYLSLTFLKGRGPVQAGSASHSAHRMRRSSSPTFTKTNGASSFPVFDPENVAGSPFAFLMFAVFAMPSPVACAQIWAFILGALIHSKVGFASLVLSAGPGCHNQCNETCVRRILLA